MKRARYAAFCLLFLGALCCIQTGKAQSPYFNRLYSLVDSPKSEGGYNILIRPDSSYFVTGYFLYYGRERYGVTNMIIARNGDSIVHQNIFYNPQVNYHPGYQGSAKHYGDGYVIPYAYWKHSLIAGIARLDENGDTIFTRNYVDTSIYIGGIQNIAVLPDSSMYLVGGFDSVTYPYSWAYILHVNSNGKVLWQRRFNRDILAENTFTSVASISFNRILIGGYLLKPAKVPQGAGNWSFNFKYPWMLILDSSGNILQERVWTTDFSAGCYLNGGDVYPDKNGGYYHWGAKDSVPRPYPDGITYWGNRPFYFAHLNTDFDIDWRFSCAGDTFYSTAVIYRAIQTADSGYLLIGDDTSPGYEIRGWLAKLDKHGKLKWKHTYQKATTDNAWFYDATERSDGSFIVAGIAKGCHTCYSDVWLLSVDSNGCEQPGCKYVFPTTVSSTPAKAEFLFYPNPTAGTITVTAPKSGTLTVLSLQGEQMVSFEVISSKQEIRLPTMAAGMYFVTYRSKDGNTSISQRLSYQP